MEMQSGGKGVGIKNTKIFLAYEVDINIHDDNIKLRGNIVHQG